MFPPVGLAVTTLEASVNLAPQFQHHASPCQERAPQFGQKREAVGAAGWDVAASGTFKGVDPW